MELSSIMKRRKSYSEEDAYHVAMRWREIESQAEEASRAIPEGMMKWIKNEENKRKYFKALGIQGATIIDDLKPEEIHAPGCTVLPPND